jgi:hypothetical protein
MENAIPFAVLEILYDHVCTRSLPFSKSKVSDVLQNDQKVTLFDFDWETTHGISFPVSVIEVSRIGEI